MRSKHGSVASFPPNRWLYSISPLRYLLEHHGHSWLAFQVDRRAEQSRAGMCPMIQLVAVSSRLCTKCIRVHQCRFENRLDREPGRTRPGRKAHWQPVNRERAQSASSLVFALPNLRFRTFRTQPKRLFYFVVVRKIRLWNFRSQKRSGFVLSGRTPLIPRTDSVSATCWSRGVGRQKGAMDFTDFDPELITALQGAQKITVLTGAGVSAESGIPTFRDALTGLWANFDAEKLATPEAFRRDPALVWGWYEWRRAQVLAARPNAAHVAISELARRVPQLTLFTQNVDDLHQRAGSTDVQHLHGSLHHPRCFECASPFSLVDSVSEVPGGDGRLSPPQCQTCAGKVRPGVVWFNELLPKGMLDRAFKSTSSSDLLIVVGTSGNVHPAARLPKEASRAGCKVIQINPEKTALDSVCTWNVRGKAGVALPALVNCAFL